MIDLKDLTLKEKIDLFKSLYKEISGKGIKGDSELAHINEFESKLLRMYGGAGTINEETGLRQYFGGGGSSGGGGGGRVHATTNPDGPRASRSPRARCRWPLAKPPHGERG